MSKGLNLTPVPKRSRKKIEESNLASQPNNMATLNQFIKSLNGLV